MTTDNTEIYRGRTGARIIIIITLILHVRGIILIWYEYGNNIIAKTVVKTETFQIQNWNRY